MGGLMRQTGDFRNAVDDTTPDYYERFWLSFDDGRMAVAVRVPYRADLQRVLEALDLTPGVPAIFISGGAGRMDEAQQMQLRPEILDGLARFAHDFGVTVIDGGTDAGVMRLMGEALRGGGRAFPLIGVAPVGAVSFPGFDNPDGVPLDTGHTHFVLTDGEKFGDESDVIARLALALSAGSGHSPFGVVVNGGDITRQETYDRALAPDTAMPLLVVDGSGRFGDELAAAAQGAASGDKRIETILERVDVHVAPLVGGPERLYAELERLISAG